MREALSEAAKSGEDVPVGAVVVYQDRIIARAHNERENGGGPFAHAEMLAMQRVAEVLGTRRLHGCKLVVTLEPCPLCSECVFGAYDPKQGCCGSVYDLPHDPAFSRHVPCIGGVLEEECAEMLRAFFAEKRA